MPESGVRSYIQFCFRSLFLNWKNCHRYPIFSWSDVETARIMNYSALFASQERSWTFLSSQNTSEYPPSTYPIHQSQSTRTDCTAPVNPITKKDTYCIPWFNANEVSSLRIQHRPLTIKFNYSTTERAVTFQRPYQVIRSKVAANCTIALPVIQMFTYDLHASWFHHLLFDFFS